MVFTRQKSRAGANPESPARTHPGTNICEGSNPRRKVFTREHNDLLFQRLVQYYQERKSDELHYHVLGLNDSSTDYDTKKAYPYLDLQFHPDKNQNSQVTNVMKIINEANK